MPKKLGNNKLEPGTREASAEANASLTDNVHTNSDQHAVLQAIESLKQDLMTKMEEKATAQSEELRSQVTQIRTELRGAVEKVNKRIESTEGQVSELQAEVSSHSDSIASMESNVNSMKRELAVLRDRCEDLEARSRRCNIRITGVKEGCEHGKHPSEFVANLLKVILELFLTRIYHLTHI